MAIYECVQKLGTQQGPLIRPDGSRIYRVTYLVRCDRTTTGKDLYTHFVDHPDLPVRGRAHPDDPGAICKELAPKQDAEAPTVWEVAVVWDSKQDEQEHRDIPPAERPIRWRWDKVTYEEYQFKDLDGKPFRNTADTPLDPPPSLVRTHMKLILERNELSYNYTLALKFADAVNDGPFLGLKKGKVKSTCPVANEEREEGESYWKVQYEFEIRGSDPTDNDLWITSKIPNMGRRARPAAGEPAIAVKDANNTIDGIAVLLRENGTELPEDEPIHYLEFRRYHWQNFSELNLP
jgi:hypothetical protein